MNPATTYPITNDQHNLSSNTTSNEPTPSWQPIFFGSFYFLLAAPCFLMHLIVFLSLLKVQGGIHQFSNFYILLTNHYLADAIKVVIYMSYACPCIWAQSQVYGNTMGKILSECQTVDYVAILLSTFLMSVNRALAIGAESLNEVIFTNRLCVFYNILTWVAGTVVCGINHLLSCATVFLEKKFIFTTMCAQKPAASASSITVYVFGYCVLVFYLFAIFSLAKWRKRVSNPDVDKNVAAYQFRLFLQALFIWIGVVGNAAAFRIIPLFTPGVGTVVATGIAVISQSYITPVTMIVFVKDTRRGMKQLFHGFIDLVKKLKASYVTHVFGRHRRAWQ